MYDTLSKDAASFYEAILPSQPHTDNNKAIYTEILYILQSPHRVVQFMGLYELMARKINKNEDIKQSKVHDFFRKNKDLYPFIEFSPSRKKYSKKEEDSFTSLRNAIAHSEQLGS